MAISRAQLVKELEPPTPVTSVATTPTLETKLVIET